MAKIILDSLKKGKSCKRVKIKQNKILENKIRLIKKINKK